VQADWSIVKRGWDAHVLGKAPHTFKDALTAVKTLRVSDYLLIHPAGLPGCSMRRIGTRRSAYLLLGWE
jgi:hypothetical protein